MSTELWQTALRFPAVHGFTTRLGGVSEGSLASLNLGPSVGDVPERVTENLGRLCTAIGLDVGNLQTVSQVHGTEVYRARVARRGQGQRLPRPEADAVLTAEPGTAVAVSVADCVPILLADPEARRVGAVHSGWRGTFEEIAARAVEAFARDGSRPAALRVAIGPSIRPCCYVVGEDLASRFRARFGAEVVTGPDGAPHLDLVRAIRQSLRRAGVLEERIEVLPACTSCDAVRYYSHRRDRGETGRHLAFVANVFRSGGTVS